MASASFPFNDLCTQAITHSIDGVTYLTVTDDANSVVLQLGPHGLAQVHRESGEGRTSLAHLQREVLPLMEQLRYGCESCAASSDVRSSAMTQHPAGKGGVA